MLSGADIHHVNAHGHNALMFAAANGNVVVVKALLKAGDSIRGLVAYLFQFGKCSKKLILIRWPLFHEIGGKQEKRLHPIIAYGDDLSTRF